jgi:phage-related minor tail protein
LSEDLATLGIAVDARPVDSASSSLDGLVNSGAKAESQVDKLIQKSKTLSGAANALGTSVDEVDRRVESLKNSIDPLYAAQSKLNKELEEAKALYKAGAISADDYGKASDVLNSRLNKVELVHARVAKGMKVTSNEMLNLTRQGSDLAVSLAMGMNPLMVLIQQGPQIADVFQTAATRGASRLC